jgi:KDO2-lipid IV(A) lauroyltransferase
MAKRIRRFATYVLIRALMALAAAAPRRVGRAFFAGLGRIAYRAMAGSRAVARANIELAYGPAMSDAEKGGLARAAFENLGMFAYDVAKTRAGPPGDLTRMTEVRGRHHLDRALEAGRGVIAITGHVGNWELLGSYFSRTGYAVSVLATELKDARLNSVLLDIRRSAGLEVIDRSRGLKDAYRCLKRGDILGVLIDQDTSVESASVDFFGKPAQTAVGFVKLAERTGAAIVPMAMVMTRGGNYEIIVNEPVPVGHNGSSLELDVERCSKAVEGFIRDYPSQWVWMHKRWKSVMPELYR